ncbi:MAG: YbaB/EbfC family nucleoid-associated protein [Armatimonadota bacterium]
MNLPFPGMFGSNMMKLVQGWVENQQRLVGELEGLRVVGSVGGGVVKATATGMGRLLEIELAPEVVNPEDVEMLQDLIVTAVQQAMAKAEEAQREKGVLGLNPRLLSDVMAGAAGAADEES